jgi:hypothetical protein
MLEFLLGKADDGEVEDLARAHYKVLIQNALEPACVADPDDFGPDPDPTFKKTGSDP